MQMIERERKKKKDVRKLHTGMSVIMSIDESL